MNMIKRLAALLIALMLIIAAPTDLMAASIEFTVPLKTALDKTIAAADTTSKGTMNLLYSSLIALQEQDQNEDESIRTIQYRNEEALIMLRKQMKQINADKIIKLDNELKQTQERYKPMFALYNSLNTLFGSQANGMKAAVQLAHYDIRTKQNSLNALKETTSKTIRSIRGILADRDPIEVQIKAERSESNTPRKRISSVWESFKQTVKKNDAKSTMDSLTTLVSLSRQIVDHKQKIHALENKINDIILKAKKLI
jgi:seryl-tRNA synthetase